eukprot:gene19554-25453_t
MDNTDQLNIEIESDNNSNNKSSVDEWDEEMQELQEPDIEEINNDDVDNESMDNSTILNEVKSNIDESKVTEVEKANETTTNRRLSGRSNIGKSSHYADEDFEYEDTKYELPDFLRIAEVPLRKYYSDRLLQVIFLLRGNEDSLKGWKVQIEYESKGVMTGLIEVYYVNNRKKKCRNRVEVASFLGLLPPVKNLKNMSRDQLYLIAMETREKHLISQLVLASNGLCDEIRYINDNAFITYHLNAIKYSLSSTKVPEVLIKPDDSESKVSNSQSKTNENLFFAFGNTTVISWGNINSTTQFHNNKYLIPLGFKCIRQEYDMLLDKIVDCLCEISSITETTSSGTTTSPLFRLTVSWQLNNGTFHPRVYEAKSPQQAWQAAMLEKLGSVSDSEDNELLSLDLITTSKFEDFDEEEKLLRNKIREERRVYFRSLRNEQKQGIQGAVKPRLNIENVETFIDDSILRFIEGMQGNKKTIEVDTDAIYEDDFYDAYMDGDMDPMEVDNGSDLDIDLENDDAIYDSDFEDLYNAPVDSNKQISNSTTNKPTDANTNSANSNIESKDTALLTKRRSILHDWEQRRLSRRRGREDCLMNQSLLVDIFNTTDVYGFEEKDEYGNIIENILGSFYQTLAPSLIKSLVIRTPDDMILEEWMLGFDNKSHDLTSSKNTIFETCAFCGKEENFIASSFVWGQTWCEFIDEKFNKSINASNDINNTTVNNNNHIDKDIDIDINPTSNDYDDIIDKTNDQFGQELEEPIVRRGRC